MFGVPVCSHCHQPIYDVRHGIRLTPLKVRIFDLIERAGRDGIALDDLYHLIGGRERGIERETVKSHINQINDLFEATDIIIRSTLPRGGGRGGGRWRIVRRVVREVA